MRKSRLLALFLTVVFVLASVTVPAFADNKFVYGDPAEFMVKVVSGETVRIGDTAIPSPIAGHPFHIAYTWDGTGPMTYTLYGNTNATQRMSFDDNGLLTIAPNTGFTALNAVSVASYNRIWDGDARVFAGDVSSTFAQHKISSLLNGFYFPFDRDAGYGLNPESDAYGNGMRPPRSVIRSSITAGTNSDADKVRDLAIVSDASGRVYATTTSGIFTMYPNTFLSTAGGTVKASLPRVIELELKGLEEFGYASNGKKVNSFEYPSDIKMLGLSGSKINMTWVDTAVAAGATKGTEFDFENFDSNDGDWHHYKWIITPNAYTTILGDHSYSAGFDLYIDDQLVLKNVPTADWTPGGTTNFSVVADGADEVKGYGTTLGFAYDVELETTGILPGATLTASAEVAHMRASNIPEALEYAIYRSSSEDGAYTKVADGNTYVTTAADKGMFFKAAARVKEQNVHDCASEWVLSTDVVSIGSENYDWSVKPSAGQYIRNRTVAVWAPYGDETYDLPLSYTGNTDTQAEFTLSGDAYVEGKVNVVQATGAQNGVLRIGDIGKYTHKWVNNNGTKELQYYNAASGTWTTNTDDGLLNLDVAYTNGESEKDTVLVRQYKPDDYEDGVISGFGGGSTVIANDGDEHGNYLKLPNLATYEVRNIGPLSGNKGNQFVGNFVFDFDAKIDATLQIVLDPATTVKKERLSAFAGHEGYIVPELASSHMPVYVGEGWKPVRLVVDWTNAKYSAFVDGIPVVVGASLGKGETQYGLRYFQVRGSIDNFRFSNVTVKNPEVFNAKIANAAVGKALSVDYDFYCGATLYKGDANDLTTVEYMISDSPEGPWTAFAGTPSAADKGKYVKAVVTPKISYNGETIVGEAVESGVACVSDVSVNSIAIRATSTADGAALDELVDVDPQFIGVARGGFMEDRRQQAKVELTINASAAQDTNIQFILAQYDPYQGGRMEALEIVPATIGADAQNVTINFDATHLSIYTYFRLFALTNDGTLTPVSSVTYIR